MITNFDGDVPSPPRPKLSTIPDSTPWTNGQKQCVALLALVVILAIIYHVHLNISLLG